MDTLLVCVWGLHTMTSLSWLAIRAAIVSLRSNAPILDAETKQVIINMALIHTTFRSKMRFGRLSLLQYLLSANSVCIPYFYFVYCIISVCCLTA